MTRPPAASALQARRGVAGFWAWCCAIALILGLALDLGFRAGPYFWLGAERGGAAVLAAAGAALAVVAARLARALLGRAVSPPLHGGGGAGNRP